MRRRPWKAWACCAGVLGATLVARAEPSLEPPDRDSPVESSAKVTLPVAQSTPVPYPEGATGDADVALELVVDETGAVSTVTLLEGEEPFASAALGAARSFVFEPATRAGQPVAAKIRFLVRFEAAEPEVEETAEPERTADGEGVAPAPPVVPREKPEEGYTVVVRGERQSPGATKITVAESSILPGGFGDPFRSIESLPGITPIVSGVPFFFVRGAPPGNLGFFLDGVPVPLLYHAFIGPAVVHPKIIDSIEVHRGGYPARFGRFAGGIVSADTRGPPSEFRGHASIRVVDSGAWVAAPFAGHRGHATVSGRYSYTALVLSLLTEAVLEYWDYQARVSYDLTPRDTVSVFGFGAYDFIADDEREDFAGTEFHRLDLRYDRQLGKNTRARLALTGGVDRSSATNGNINDRSVRARFELTHRAGQNLEIRSGADAAVDRFRLTIDPTAAQSGDVESLFPPRDDLVFGGYTEMTWEPEPFVEVEPGVRVDVYRSTGNTAASVDPRIAARFSATDDLRLIHSFGIAHQTPNFVPSLPGARVGGLRGGLQQAIQSAAGIEHDFPADTTASLTLFHSVFFNLSDPLGFNRTIAADVDATDIRATGYAAGVELMIQRSLTRKLGGLLSYTLSRSVRSNARTNSLAAFDRTHVGNVALSYDLGRRWRIGGRFLVSTGVPTRTLTVEGPRFDGVNRPPPFFRLDLRAEKRWMLGRDTWWGLTAEILNATGSQEIVGRSCNPIRCTDSLVGPLVLPSVGAELAF